jgi:hypothetical protein
MTEAIDLGVSKGQRFDSVVSIFMGLISAERRDEVPSWLFVPDEKRTFLSLFRSGSS